MGNDNKKQKQSTPVPTAMEIKTYIMVGQNKLTLFRNKRVNVIKQKRQEIGKCLKENNLDVAKAKMDTLIKDEDIITCYDILGPICEILKEKVTYLLSSNECPPDLRAPLDTLMYASSRLEIEELHKLKNLVTLKYGSMYISKAESNADGLVNVNLIEKLKVKPAAEAFINIRLKQLCKEDKINFEFPQEIQPIDFNDIGNFNQDSFNPYESNLGGNNYQGGPGYNAMGNSNINPYAGNGNIDTGFGHFNQSNNSQGFGQFNQQMNQNNFPSQFGQNNNNGFPSQFGQNNNNNFPSQFGQNNNNSFPSQFGQNNNNEFPGLNNNPNTSFPNPNYKNDYTGSINFPDSSQMGGNMNFNNNNVNQSVSNQKFVNKPGEMYKDAGNLSTLDSKIKNNNNDFPDL